MEKLNKDRLKKLRNQLKRKYRDIEKNNTVILVGMGTCGIAAGADKVFEKFENDIKNWGIKNVILKKTGCIGLCFCEPNVEIRVPGMPEILYGNISEKLVSVLLEKHVIQHNIVDKLVFDKPSADIVKIKTEAENEE